MAAAGGGGGGAGPGRALQAAMRAASGALEMDSAGRPREAYVEYLKSIALISQALQDEAALTDGGEGLGPDTPKMLKLAEQCLERVKSLAAALGKAKVIPAPQERGGGPAPVSRHRRVFSDEGGKLSPFLPPEIFQKLQIAEAQGARKELTPLEEASLQNQKLKAAYEARVARLNPSQAVQKTSLTLSLQRQMMENLVIAKAREETLQRKMEERRLRLQEAANRRFSSSVALTPEEQEQRALYAAILEYEQDHDWPRQWKARLKRSPADLSLVTGLFSCLLSFPEHPIAQLLRKLQCAVYTRLYPAVSQSSPEAAPVASTGLAFLSLDAGGPLPAEPGGRRLRASRSLHCMFSVPEHSPAELRHSLSSAPLADSSTDTPGTEGEPQAPRESSFEDLERFLASPEDWPLGEPLAGPRQASSLQEQLKGVVRDIHNAIDRLLSLTLLAFEGLNTAAGKDQCLACIEEAFFPPLWAPLLALYRSVHRPREAALAHSMERHRNASPAEMGLPSRLFPAAPGSSPAYGAAVEDLRLIPLETCPRRKLDCIVRALRSICECAEEYCSARDSRAPASGTIGADDLLPLVSFAALRSGLPQLLPECAALEEFIHEGCLLGEEGYCLTSLRSALAYLETLPLAGPGPRGGAAELPPQPREGSAPSRDVTVGGARESGRGAGPGRAGCARARRCGRSTGGAWSGAARAPAPTPRSPRGCGSGCGPSRGCCGPCRTTPAPSWPGGCGAAASWGRRCGAWRPPSSCWSGRPSTSTSSPGARSSAPCRPSRGPTCTRCGQRCPKPTCCGASAAWATCGRTSTAWPCAAGPRAPSWPPPPAASWPAGWSARSWPRCCSGCGPAGRAPRSCWRPAASPATRRPAWRCCGSSCREAARRRPPATTTTWICTGRCRRAPGTAGSRTSAPQRRAPGCGGTLGGCRRPRTCSGGAGTSANTASSGGNCSPPSPSRTLPPSPPPLASSWSRSSGGLAAAPRRSPPPGCPPGSPRLAARPRRLPPAPRRKPPSCPATSCTPACARARCPPTAAPPASSCTPAPARPGGPAAASTAGRSCAASGSSASGCSGQRWTCCWPTAPAPGPSRGPGGGRSGTGPLLQLLL